jgi:hypothetical protein
MTASRATRHWTQLGLQVTLLLVALGLLQVAAERTGRRFDLTPTRGLSLSPVTEKIVRQVDTPMRLTVFYRRGTREQHADLLARLRVMNPRLEFELLDLDRFPDRARSLGVTQYGRAAIEYGGRRVVVPALPEEALAGGILRAMRGKARRIAFTTAHGEPRATVGSSPRSRRRTTRSTACRSSRGRSRRERTSSSSPGPSTTSCRRSWPPWRST